MLVRVVLAEGEALETALARFKKSVNLRYRMGWAKRRYNYHEKPSELRRRKKILDEIGRRRGFSLARRAQFRELFES
jgi:ribosomal protein S21